MSTIASAPFLPLKFLARAIDLESRADGTLIVRNRVPLGNLAAHVPGLLRRNAARWPERTWIAQRDRASGAWRRISYADAQRQVDAVTQALLELTAPERTVAVLSGNSIEHAIIEMAAMQARMPYVPITPAYSLASRDLGKLDAMLRLVRPAVVFAQDGVQFERALGVDGIGDAVVVCVDRAPARSSVSWQSLIETPVVPAVAASVAAIDHATVAKYLFTSGSTGVPKAVTITQGMMCAGIVMHTQLYAREAEVAHGVVLDWLPWSHVAGGTSGFNAILEDAGTLYIDEGKPLPGAFDESIRNLREISPVRFNSMPMGFAMLVDALDRDPALGVSLFRNLKRMGYSGAKLPEALYDRIQAHAVRHTAHRIPFLSGYGSTETTAAATYVYWPAERSGLIGLPHPGIEMKLVPLDDARYEVRIRGASVTPGYLQQPELTAQAFDDEGYLRMGDAATFVDRHDVNQGFAFAGRVAEEFKLQSGVFVRVGAVRVDALSASQGLLRDAVVTGADRAWVGLLAWLNVEACRHRFDRPEASFVGLASLPALREALGDALAAHNAALGTSMRIRRLLLLEEPPSIDAGEITDKGYINQRQVLTRRAAEVEALYADAPDGRVITIPQDHTP